MNKRLLLWIILIVLLISSLPGLLQRWEAESDNHTYEIAAPYQEIYDLTLEDTVLLDDALGELADAGLNAVSFDPISLVSLQNQDILSIYGQRELEEALLFSGQSLDYKQPDKGIYITVPEDAYYVDVIKKHFKPIPLTISNNDFYFIPTKDDDKDRRSNLGYDLEAIEEVKQHGLNYILRIENDEDAAVNKETLKQIIDLKQDEHSSTILFTGNEVIGFPKANAIQDSAQQLKDAGYSFHSIEFAAQKGIQAFARATDYNAVRLHSIDLRSSTDQENINKAVRAVKERHIRTIYFHLSSNDPVEGLETAVDFVTAVHKDMPRTFTSGMPKAFDQIDLPLWNKLVVLLAGILFTYLAAGIIKYRPAQITAVIGMTLLVIGYFLLQKLVFLQAFALGIAVIAPTYAVLASINHGSTKIWPITRSYLQAIGISLIGLIILLGTLNGNGFISGFEMFRGVKLVYILPILFVALFIIWNKNMRLPKSNDIVYVLKSPVKYWHLVVFILISGISFYYITRTGNAGSVSELELVLRQKLETLLYARPRTKEFLIGLPIFMLAIYTMGISKKWGKLLLIPGIIGFLSIINTFSHLHIPLDVSLLRTAYGLFLGYLFGLLYIYIFKTGYKLTHKLLKKRWI